MYMFSLQRESIFVVSQYHLVDTFKHPRDSWCSLNPGLRDSRHTQSQPWSHGRVGYQRRNCEDLGFLRST